MRKTIIVIVILISLLSYKNVSIASDKWEKSDIILESITQSLLVIDYLQSRQIVKNPYIYYESGIASYFIGAHPTMTEMTIYMGASMLIHYLIADCLPSKWRKYWAGFYMGIEGQVIMQNYQLGLSISF